MAFIRKRGSRYQVRWTGLDGTERGHSCPTARIAAAVKRQVEEAAALGVDWEPRPTGAVVDLREVMGAYIDNRALRLRPLTLRNYGHHLDVFQRYLGQTVRGQSWPASMLSRALLEDFYSWLLGETRKAKDGKPRKVRGAEAAGNTVGIVEILWAWADNSERWPDDIPRPRTIDVASPQKAAIVAPTWADMDACVEHLDPQGWHRKLALILRYQGLRPGEVMQLQWEQVDLERAEAELLPDTVKTKPRRIPLAPALVSELAGWGRREGYVVACDIVDRTRPVTSVFKRAWERGGVRARVWERHSALRAFRRGFKSGMLASGAHPDAIDFLQGHVSRGARSDYIDPWVAFDLRGIVASVPVVGASEANVVRMDRAEGE